MVVHHPIVAVLVRTYHWLGPFLTFYLAVYDASYQSIQSTSLFGGPRRLHLSAYTHDQSPSAGFPRGKSLFDVCDCSLNPEFATPSSLCGKSGGLWSGSQMAAVLRCFLPK